MELSPGEPRMMPVVRDGCIDVHHHLGPKSWMDLLQSKGILHGPWQKWSVGRTLDEMDRDHVALAMTSVTTPGVWFGDNAAARALARECNEYAATLVRQYPGRFGTFATLPLPDIDGALAEIEYALDVLQADGICMYTSYNNTWLGDAFFEPILSELARRKAVLYVHPTVPTCCKGILPFLLSSMLEYATDTTRAIASLLFTGTSTRYRDLTIIFSHAGGTMPFLIERFFRQKLASQLDPNIEKGSITDLDPLQEVRNFYYDTAQSSNPAPMSALRQVVPISQILFGSDFPYRTAEEQLTALQGGGIFSPNELTSICRHNAAQILPRVSGKYV